MVLALVAALFWMGLRCQTWQERSERLRPPSMTEMLADPDRYGCVEVTVPSHTEYLSVDGVWGPEPSPGAIAATVRDGEEDTTFGRELHVPEEWTLDDATPAQRPVLEQFLLRGTYVQSGSAWECSGTPITSTTLR